MARYMVKSYDRRGRLLGRFEFFAPDDREAVGAADDLDREDSQELWCGERWIRSWPARSCGGTGVAVCRSAMPSMASFGCYRSSIHS